MFYRSYYIEHEQSHRLEPVREGNGHQTSNSDRCPKDTGKVTCCFMRQRHRWCHTVGIDKSGICTLTGEMADSFMCSAGRVLCETDFVGLRVRKILCGTQFVKCTSYYLSAALTHHNTIGHKEHHPAKNMNHKEGYWQPAQVIILTAAKDIPVTWNRASQMTDCSTQKGIYCVFFPCICHKERMHYSFKNRTPV